MNHTIMIIAALCASYSGMASLCLTMGRHYKKAFGKDSSRSLQRNLYWSGWILLAVALVFSGLEWGWIIGPFAWLGMLTATSSLLIFIFSYQSRLAALSGELTFFIFAICTVAFATQ